MIPSWSQSQGALGAGSSVGATSPHRRNAPEAVPVLGHDEPQQDQDSGAQDQAPHVAPGVICRGQEGTVTADPHKGAVRPKEPSHRGNRGPKGTEGAHVGLPGQTDTMGKRTVLG